MLITWDLFFLPARIIWIGYLIWDLQLVPQLERLLQLGAQQNGRQFAADNLKRIYLREKFRILIQISLKLVPEIPLFQAMAWHRRGVQPLS